MKPKAIIFDLDGVLCELGDSNNPYNHDGEEILIPLIYDIYMGIDHINYTVIILTGRKRKDYEKVTVEWLMDNNIQYDYLIMQEGSQGEKNEVYKEKELIKLQEKYDIIAMFDDNEKLVPVCKKLGILLLQVHK